MIEDQLVDLGKALLNVGDREAEEVDDEFVARCASKTAAVEVWPDVFLKVGDASKAEVFGLLGGENEAGAMERDTSAAEVLVGLKGFGAVDVCPDFWSAKTFPTCSESSTTVPSDRVSPSEITR